MSGQKDDLGAAVRDLRTGLKTAVPKKLRSLTVGAEVYSIPHLVKIVEGYEALWVAVEDLSAAFHGAVQTRDSKAPVIREFVNELKMALIVALGSKNPELTKFGIEPKKERKKLSAEERALANAKIRATRKERHTMGRRQKEEISGDVTQVTLGEAAAAPATEKKPQA